MFFSLQMILIVALLYNYVYISWKQMNIDMNYTSGVHCVLALIISDNYWYLLATKSNIFFYLLQTVFRRKWLTFVNRIQKNFLQIHCATLLYILDDTITKHWQLLLHKRENILLPDLLVLWSQEKNQSNNLCPQ